MRAGCPAGFPNNRASFRTSVPACINPSFAGRWCVCVCVCLSVYLSVCVSMCVCVFYFETFPFCSPGRNLENNQITSIASGAFSGLGRMTELYLALRKCMNVAVVTQWLCRFLHSNRITWIESGAFSGLGRLTELYVTLHSHIATLPVSLLHAARADPCATTKSQRLAVAHSLDLGA